MNYYLIFIIVILGFFTFQYFNKSETKSKDQEYTSNFKADKKLKINDKLIEVKNADYNSIKKAVQDFTKNYDNQRQKNLKPISKLHKVNNYETIITFPYDIDFEIFCYYVNYLKYPIDLKYKADVKGWTSVKSSDNWLNNQLDQRKVMLFIDPNDEDYDNILMTTENGKNYKIGFAVGEGLQNQNNQILKYVPSKYFISDLESLESEIIR